MPADLAPPPGVRPADLAPADARLGWNQTYGKLLEYYASGSKSDKAKNIAYVRASMFAPPYLRADGWEGVIRASQNPAHCSRFLLLEDDMINSGFGMDQKMLAVAMLMAVGQQRVLLHVPRPGGFPYKHFPNTSSGRWTGRFVL